MSLLSGEQQMEWNGSCCNACAAYWFGFLEEGREDVLDLIRFDLTKYVGSDHYNNMSLYQQSLTLCSNRQIACRCYPITTVVFQ
jgi:hypothetical protein